MKRLMAAAVTVMLLMPLLLAAQPNTPEHKYIGVDRCRICHMSKKSGDQYGVWKGSKHAQAYTTLTTPAAKAVAEKAGQGAKAPHENPECLRCHVTAFGVADQFKGPKFNQTEGVGCEVCHGPGEDYSPMKVMRDPAAAAAAGLKFMDEAGCKHCHNPESPTYKPFTWAEFWPKVAHDNPVIPPRAK